MNVIPAIDLRGGRAVRLTRGDFEQERTYSDDPVAVARSFAGAGARRIHVVDLDAARGGADNRDAVRAILAALKGVEVQLAGGLRDAGTVAAALDAGAAAVVVGTLAVRDPDALAAIATDHRGRVLAALDVRAGEPAVAGWAATEGIALGALLQRWQAAPLAGVVLTAIDRDGSLEGPDLELLREVRRMTGHPLTYSGGIGGLEDCRATLASGAAAVIAGKSIYEGRLDLRAALAA